MVPVHHCTGNPVLATAVVVQDVGDPPVAASWGHDPDRSRSLQIRGRSASTLALHRGRPVRPRSERCSTEGSLTTRGRGRTPDGDASALRHMRGGGRPSGCTTSERTSVPRFLRFEKGVLRDTY